MSWGAEFNDKYVMLNIPIKIFQLKSDAGFPTPTHAHTKHKIKNGAGSMRILLN
jgi:hypothetical protein